MDTSTNINRVRSRPQTWWLLGNNTGTPPRHTTARGTTATGTPTTGTLPRHHWTFCNTTDTPPGNDQDTTGTTPAHRTRPDQQCDTETRNTTGTSLGHHRDTTGTQRGTTGIALHHRDTTGTPPGHHRDTTGTPRDTTGTPPGHHRTTGTPPGHNRDTTGTPRGKKTGTPNRTFSENGRKHEHQPCKK